MSKASEFELQTYVDLYILIRSKIASPPCGWLLKGVDFEQGMMELLEHLNKMNESILQEANQTIPSTPTEHTAKYTLENIIEWESHNWTNFRFWGCRIPNAVAAVLKAKGAEVVEMPPHFPFSAFRNTLYSQQELQAVDPHIFSFFLKNENSVDPLISSMMALHDQSIKTALLQYVQNSGRKVVTILGGHDVKRCSDQYRQVVHLTHNLVQQGFIIVSGGGPGAMEAANFGAYLHERNSEEVEAALNILMSTKINKRLAFEYLSTAPADKVIEHLGIPSSEFSIGIPTWRYGREPSNHFATLHAKLFSSALRLDALVAVASGGVIFTPGGAGTREEIFYATREHHFFPHKQAPIIFFGQQFWTDNGVFPISKQLSHGRNYHDNITCTDSITDIVKVLCSFKFKK